ncbi:MAG: hypothetical protein ACLPX9_10935 [Rhodomicrobium sp.]
MSISVGSTPNTANVKAPAPAPASTQRAADGDYKTPGQGRAATVKDTDGDYKALSTAASTSSSSVHTAVSGLTTGGSKA